jgi:hypothetical protein
MEKVVTYREIVVDGETHLPTYTRTVWEEPYYEHGDSFNGRALPVLVAAGTIAALISLFLIAVV